MTTDASTNLLQVLDKDDIMSTQTINPESSLAARYLPRKLRKTESLSNLMQKRPFDGEMVKGRQHSAVDAPITLISSDVLLLVFQQYIFSYGNIPLDCFHDVTFAPWLLGQVCRQWRSISSSSLNLWTDVYIKSCCQGSFECVQERSIKEKEAVSYLLSRQMELSHDRPLNVSLKLDAIGVTYPESLDIILPHRHRWKTLHLDDTPDEYEEMEEDQIDERVLTLMDPTMQATAQKIFLSSSETPLEFTLLEELYVTVDSETRLDIFANNSFPRLTKFYFGKYISPFPRAAPYKNINDLFFHVVSAEDLISILPLLISLRRLAVGYILSDGPTPKKDPAILPRLEDLSMWMGWASAMQCMTAPALKLLQISEYDLGYGMDGTDDFSAVLDMAHRSSSPISTFKFCLPIPIDPTMDSLFSSMPNLTDLSVDIYCGDKDVAASNLLQLSITLGARDSEGNFSFCPRLQKINAYYEDVASIENEGQNMAFLDSLEARFDSPNSTFRSANLIGVWDSVEGDHSLGRRLVVLRARGLDI